MYNSSATVKVLGIALLLFASVVDGCSCISSTVRSVFSDPEEKNVILGKVIDEVNPCPGNVECPEQIPVLYYKVEIERVFKGCLSTKACSRPNTIWISSAAFPNSCGTTLDVGTSYLLGLPDAKIPEVHLCSLIKPWIDMEASDLKFLTSMSGTVCRNPEPMFESLLDSGFESPIPSDIDTDIPFPSASE